MRVAIYRIVIFTLILGLGLTEIGFAGTKNRPPQKPIHTMPVNAPDQLASQLPIRSRSFDIGTAGLVPPNWPKPSRSDWTSFFASIPEYGELYGVHSGWNDKRGSDGIPETVKTSFDVTKGKPVSVYVGFGVEGDHMSQQEADTFFQNHGAEFKRSAVAIAEKYKPGMMVIGVEANRFYEKSPKGYQDFMRIYHELYDEIKRVSPNTKVGSNFQYEYMRGAAKLTGRQHRPHWEVIQWVNDKSDFVSITTYPWFDFQAPHMIPMNYYADLKQYTNKPIIITETGWPSQSTRIRAASEQAQIEYLKVLLIRTRSINLMGLMWVFPNDGTFGIAGGIFDYISMKRKDGSPKQVYAYWQALKSLPRK